MASGGRGVRRLFGFLRDMDVELYQRSAKNPETGKVGSHNLLNGYTLIVATD